MADRREFLAAAAAFAAGAAVSEGAASASASHLVTILNGDGPPPRRLGIVGDFYIDDRAHTIYGPKRKAGWHKPTQLIGPRGRPGYSVLHGRRPPAPREGIDNDFYIDTATTQLYGPKQGGVWGSPVSLTGAAHIEVIDGGTP